MRILAATLLIIASAGPASAYCVPLPDDQASAYVRNGLNTAICLNEELAAATAQRNWQVRINTATGRLDRDFVSSKLDAIRPMAIPTPTSPAWP